MQGYDESLASYPESRDLFAPPRANKPTAFNHAILHNGKVVGGWRNGKPRELEITGIARGPAFDDAVARYSRFLGDGLAIKRSRR